MQLIKRVAVKIAEISVLFYTGTQFALAEECTDPASGTISQGAACAKPKGAREDLFGGSGIFSVVTTTLIFLVGAISVIMLIIGGLRYVFSQGEASAVKGAKDTILYAIIGIIVAILAYAAVQFVISRFAT